MFINDTARCVSYLWKISSNDFSLSPMPSPHFPRGGTSDNIKNKLSGLLLALKGFIDKNFISMGWVMLLLISLLSGAKLSNDITGLSLTLS